MADEQNTSSSSSIPSEEISELGISSSDEIDVLVELSETTFFELSSVGAKKAPQTTHTAIIKKPARNILRISTI